MIFKLEDLEMESPHFISHVEFIFGNFKGNILILNELPEFSELADRIMANSYFNGNFFLDYINISSFNKTLRQLDEENEKVKNILDRHSDGAGISHDVKIDVELVLSEKNNIIRDEVLFYNIKEKMDKSNFVFIFNNGKVPSQAKYRSFSNYSALMVKSIKYAIQTKKYLIFNDYAKALDLDIQEETV